MAQQTKALMASAFFDLEARLLSRNKITIKNACLLAYLARGNSPTMTEISQSLGVSTAAITGCINRLVKLGFVQRIHPADDRRKYEVKITKNGIAFCEKMDTTLEEIFLEAIVSDGRPALTKQGHPLARKSPTLQIPLVQIMGAA